MIYAIGTEEGVELQDGVKLKEIGEGIGEAIEKTIGSEVTV